MYIGTIGDDGDDPWEGVGITFNFTPETFAKIASDGKEYRGEYGTYKLLKSYTDAKFSKKNTATVCLISDKLIPVGTVFSLSLDGWFGVYYYKFYLNLPWKKQDETLSYKVTSYDYLKTKCFETTDFKKLPKLMNRAVKKVISLTEEELASKLTDGKITEEGWR
ncbi:MAG: hypothetical protein WCS37_09285 [Chloroflexota bacterium]|nr:hypothetical protein [Chloroflexota bacterium]